MISFVVCSIDPAKFNPLAQSLAEKMAGEPYELVGIHDAKGLCEGYNRGAARARGETIVFCHDDIEILTPRLAPRLKHAMSQFDIVGIAGTSRVIGSLWSFAGPPYLFGQVAHYAPSVKQYDVSVFATPRPLIDGIHALDGVFLSVRRSVLERIRFDESTFDGWHLYDMDFTFAAHLAGFRIGVSCEIQLSHNSMGQLDQAWMKYAQLFNRKYLDQLYPMVKRPFAICQVRVGTREEVLEVMTPRFWGDVAVS